MVGSCNCLGDCYFCSTELIDVEDGTRGPAGSCNSRNALGRQIGPHRCSVPKFLLRSSPCCVGPRQPVFRPISSTDQETVTPFCCEDRVSAQATVQAPLFFCLSVLLHFLMNVSVEVHLLSNLCPMLVLVLSGVESGILFSGKWWHSVHTLPAGQDSHGP